MNKISVLALQGGSYRLTSSTLYCLGQHENIEVHFLTRKANSPFRLSVYVRTHNYFSVQNSDEEFLFFIKNIVEKTKAKVFFPIGIEAVSFAVKYHSQIKKFINLIPLPDAETFKIAADKGLLAEFMINNNIPTPDTIFNLTEDLEENLNKFRFPVLLKPKEGLAGKNLSGGPGITLFEEKQKLFKFISERNIKSQYIIQSFTEGYVLGCNVLYKDGHLLTYSIQKGLIPASNKFAPSLGIEFYENEEVISVADQLMSKLRWNGLANIDLIYDIKEQKIKVLEINPRVWTNIIGSMVTAKINFPVLACKLALDMPVEYTPSEVGKYIAVREFLTYNYVNRFNKKVNFNFKDIHIKYTVVTLLPKLLAVVTLLPKLLEMSNRRKKT